MKLREMLPGAQTAFATQDHSRHMHGGGKYAALAARWATASYSHHG